MASEKGTSVRGEKCPNSAGRQPGSIITLVQEKEIGRVLVQRERNQEGLGTKRERSEGSKRCKHRGSDREQGRNAEGGRRGQEMIEMFFACACA